jgi:hypothetical protein
VVTQCSLHVLAFGINEYPGRLKLNDARAIVQVFKDKNGGLFKSVHAKLLVDKTPRPGLIVERRQ